MDTGYAAYYRKLYEGHWWWRSREEILVQLIKRITPPEGWGQILDVGCGDGLFFPLLRQWGEVTGVEPDGSMVTDTHRADGQIHVVEFDQLFRPDQTYGLILMLDVLEHLDDPAAAIRRARELLRPGGVLLATVPAYELIWTRHDDLNRHRIRYTRGSFEALVESGGLRVTRGRYAFHALFFAKVVTRILESVSKAEPEVPSIPAGWVNRLLSRYCVLEHRIVGPLRLPFGSSFMAVCEVAQSDP